MLDNLDKYVNITKPVSMSIKLISSASPAALKCDVLDHKDSNDDANSSYCVIFVVKINGLTFETGAFLCSNHASMIFDTFTDLPF